MLFPKCSQVSGERLLNMSTEMQLCKKTGRCKLYIFQSPHLSQPSNIKSSHLGCYPIPQSSQKTSIIHPHLQREIWPSDLYQMTPPHLVTTVVPIRISLSVVWNCERGKSVSYSIPSFQPMYTQGQWCNHVEHMLSSKHSTTGKWGGWEKVKVKREAEAKDHVGLERGGKGSRYLVPMSFQPLFLVPQIQPQLFLLIFTF